MNRALWELKLFFKKLIGYNSEVITRVITTLVLTPTLEQSIDMYKKSCIRENLIQGQLHEMYREGKSNLLKFPIPSAMITISNRKQKNKTVKWVVHVSPTNVKRAGSMCFPSIYDVCKIKTIRFILYIHRLVSV